MGNKMERFTNKARHSLMLAQEAAEELKSNTIDTEHVLIGLIREKRSSAGKWLRSYGYEEKEILDFVIQFVSAKSDDENTKLELSSQVKHLLELSVGAARRFGNHYIAPEHLLFALTRQPNSHAVYILQRLGADINKMQNETECILATMAPKFPVSILRDKGKSRK